MPPTDRVLAEEIRAHVHETRASHQSARQAEYDKLLTATRAYIRAPENREKVRDAVRPMLAEAIRTRRDAWAREDIELLCARDAQMRGFLEGPQTRDIGPAAVHVNQLMTNLSVRYTNPDYIGEMIAPPLAVDKESNIFAVYDERANLAFPSNAVGPKGAVPEVNQAVDKSTNTYVCKPYGFKDVVSPREIANADSPLDPLLDAQLLVMEGNGWNRETNAATFFTTTSNYASANVVNISAGDEWDSAGGGNPAKLIMDAVKGIFRSRGIRKVGGCSIDTFAVLSRHPAILDVNKYKNTGFLTIEQLKSYFMLDELYVGEAWKDTANSGQTASYSRIWGDSFFVVGMQPGGAATTRSYQFSSRFRKGGMRSETLYVPHEGMEGMFHVKETYLEDLKGVASRAGWIITNCLA